MLCLFNKISNCQEAFDNSASATLCSWVFLSIVVNRCAALLGIGLSSAQVMTQKWTLGSLKMHKQFFTWSIQTKANSKPMHVDATKRGEQCKGRAINRVSNKRSNNNSASANKQQQSRQGQARKEIREWGWPTPAPRRRIDYYIFSSCERTTRREAKRNAASWRRTHRARKIHKPSNKFHNQQQLRQITFP